MRAGARRREPDMDRYRIERIAAVISYIESHLNEKTDLDTLARAAFCSGYHLHRMFTETVGLTPHDYIRRRKLTRAAWLLVFSLKPIMEIALTAGYESQQAFTTVFGAMYKQPPMVYRKNKVFYPLQLKFTPNPAPSSADAVLRTVSHATPEDLPGWMDFVSPVIGGFPCLEKALHLAQVKQYIERKQALIMRDGTAIIGAAAFSPQTGSIDFLAAHPQYRHHGVTEALLDSMIRHSFTGRRISITTFREGDKADTGQRAEYLRLGFTESELLTEFGYPTQRLILLPDQKCEGSDNG